MSQSIYDFKVDKNNGETIDLSQYKGKTLLIVNTASKCGFTPQYKGLQKLYEDYNKKGLEILGFPCNQFAGQEPGSDSDIKQFCQIGFGVTFPLFKKINVNGKNAHPLYQYLTKALPGALGKRVKWNFTKFLIDPQGNPVRRFASAVEPESLRKELEPFLK